jgi:hypothetical protein
LTAGADGFSINQETIPVIAGATGAVTGTTGAITGRAGAITGTTGAITGTISGVKKTANFATFPAAGTTETAGMVWKSVI